MSEVPTELPVTTPLAEPTLATAGILLIHVPDDGDALNVLAEPVQIVSKPLIAPGDELTLTVVATKQPPAIVYVMPAAPLPTPSTTPDVEPTWAIAELLLVQVPPAGVEFNVVVRPIQTDVVPVIAEAPVDTVTC
jgi:hypothetical protein